MKKLIATLLIAVSPAFAFELKSNDIKANGTIGDDFVYNEMGCPGKNLSPELHWSGAPKETKSFALTMYDPAAPTGSGWWHWIVVDIPASATSFTRGKVADGAKEVAQDFGPSRYDGPCPPPGKPHPYTFTLHALNTAKLEVPAGATHAFYRYMIEGATIGKAKFTAHYGRKNK